MKRRVALWAVAGALVVVFWTLYIAATHANPLSAGGVGRALVCFTCPIALASRYPLGIYFVLMANAATYAVVGALVEVTRRYCRTRPISN